MSGDNLFCKTCKSHHHAATECQTVECAENDKLRSAFFRVGAAIPQDCIECAAAREGIAELEAELFKCDAIMLPDKDAEIEALQRRIAELEEELQTHINCATQYFNEKAVLEQRIADAPHDDMCKFAMDLRGYKTPNKARKCTCWKAKEPPEPS